MVHELDLKRILNSDKVRLIDNAKKACENSQTEWAKSFWFGVWKTLCQKYGRMDLYLKDLH